jgi:transcriptional regulator with XRE-family HTH domain
MTERTPGHAIGDKVRELRERGFFTRRELAQRSGLAQITLQHLEHGMSARPRRQTLEKVANGLSVPIDVLLEAAEDEDPKAEAPPSPAQASFNGLLEDERRRDRLDEIRQSFREARDGLDRYCDLWERRLDDDDLNREAVRGFLDAAGALLPTLTDLAAAELVRIARVFGVKEGSGVSAEMRNEAQMIHAAHRYNDLGRTLQALWQERYAEDAGAEVIDFERYMRKTG